LQVGSVPTRLQTSSACPERPTPESPQATWHSCNSLHRFFTHYCTLPPDLRRKTIAGKSEPFEPSRLHPPSLSRLLHTLLWTFGQRRSALAAASWQHHAPRIPVFLVRFLVTDLLSLTFLDTLRTFGASLTRASIPDIVRAGAGYIIRRIYDVFRQPLISTAENLSSPFLPFSSVCSSSQLYLSFLAPPLSERRRTHTTPNRQWKPPAACVLNELPRWSARHHMPFVDFSFSFSYLASSFSFTTCVRQRDSPQAATEDETDLYVPITVLPALFFSFLFFFLSPTLLRSRTMLTDTTPPRDSRTLSFLCFCPPFVCLHLLYSPAPARSPLLYKTQTHSKQSSCKTDFLLVEVGIVSHHVSSFQSDVPFFPLYSISRRSSG